MRFGPAREPSGQAGFTSAAATSAQAVATPRQPAPEGGDPALAVGRQPELLHQARGRAGVPGGHGVLRRFLGPTVVQEPPGGAAPGSVPDPAVPARPAACRGTGDGSHPPAPAGAAAPAAGSTRPDRPGPRQPRQCRALPPSYSFATSSSPSGTPAARSSEDASAWVSDRSPGPISVILPSA